MLAHPAVEPFCISTPQQLVKTNGSIYHPFQGCNTPKKVVIKLTLRDINQINSSSQAPKEKLIA